MTKNPHLPGANGLLFDLEFSPLFTPTFGAEGTPIDEDRGGVSRVGRDFSARRGSGYGPHPSDALAPLPAPELRMPEIQTGAQGSIRSNLWPERGLFPAAAVSAMGSSDYRLIATGINVSDDWLSQVSLAAAADDRKGLEFINEMSDPAPIAMSINAFNLTSKGDARHTIYLDFNGHKTDKTSWNTTYNRGRSFTTPAFSMDASAGFSAAEQARIIDIWRRVAEDFRPFNVNVTTKAPPLANLMKSGPNDSRWGIRVVVGGLASQWLGGNGGGIAYQNSFTFDSDTPLYIFSRAFNENERFVADAITHETGHALGLDHDGTRSPAREYYAGHGSGVTGWAPIMGNPYYKELTQWSKGEYASASNRQDDLAIITSAKNGIGYRNDDHGNSTASDTPLRLIGDRFYGDGIIERNTDVDFFSFGVQTSGEYQINVTPFFKGPNLDLAVVIYDRNGKAIRGYNPTDDIKVTARTMLTPGKYYLRVTGVGSGNPGGTGYSNYGSLGQYNIRIIPNNINVITPTVEVFQRDAAKSEGDAGPKAFRFRLVRQGNLQIESRVDYRISGVSSGNSVDRFDFVNDVFARGTATFQVGQAVTLVSAMVSGDRVWERHERMAITISNPFNSTIAKATAVGTVYNDDAIGGVAALTLPQDQDPADFQPVFNHQESSISFDLSPFPGQRVASPLQDGDFPEAEVPPEDVRDGGPAFPSLPSGNFSGELQNRYADSGDRSGVGRLAPVSFELDGSELDGSELGGSGIERIASKPADLISSNSAWIG